MDKSRLIGESPIKLQENIQDLRDIEKKNKV